MHTFSVKPFKGFPVIEPGHLSDWKLEKKDIIYLLSRTSARGMPFRLIRFYHYLVYCMTNRREWLQDNAHTDIKNVRTVFLTKPLFVAAQQGFRIPFLHGVGVALRLRYA